VISDESTTEPNNSEDQKNDITSHESGSRDVDEAIEESTDVIPPRQNEDDGEPKKDLFS
jgi:hypothetical protein